MKRILICFLLACPAHFLTAGTAADSLHKILSAARNDTAKVNTLNALASELAQKQADSSLLVARTALKLSQQLHYKEGMATSLLNVGQIQYNRSELDSALSNYNRSLELWKELASHGELSFAHSGSYARAYGNIGNIYSLRSDYPKALEYFGKALDIDRKSGNKKGVARHLGNIGIVHKKRGDLPKALNFYLEALRMHEELDNKSGISLWKGNIGILYTTLGDTAKARKYLCDALKTDEEMNNKSGVERHLSNLGILYYKQGRKEEALNYYNRALAIAEEIKDRNFVGLQLGNIGVIYVDKGDLKTAMEHYQRALTIDRELGNQNYTAAMLGNIGGLYYRMKDYARSEQYIKEALALSKQMGTLEYTSEFEQHYSRLDSVRGDYKGALEHYKRYIEARDSVSNQENTRKTVQLQMQYDFDKKEAADSIRNAELVKQEELKHDEEVRQQRLYTYGGLIGFVLMLIVAGVSFRAYRQKQHANTLITEQKNIVEQKQKEILDSIHYAKRIQDSLLPSDKAVTRNMKRLRKG